METTVDEQEKEPKKKPEIFNDDKCVRNYSDFLRTRYKSAEFMLSFGQIENKELIRIVEDIYISPLRIKSFIRSMERAVKQYEEKYNIVLPETAEDFFSKK